MIKGVIFDFGGVLSLPQDSAFYVWARQETGLDEATFRGGFARYRLRFDQGRLSGREMYRLILTDNGVEADEARCVALAAHDFESWTRPNLETLAWVKSLKAAGLRVGVLTNMPLDFVPNYSACTGDLRGLLDAEVISADVDLVKPDPKIYELALARIGLRADEVFYFDDLAVNVEAARAVGMRAACFTTVTQARLDLAQVL